MFGLDPNTLYSWSDLTSLLEPLGIDPDTFIARIKPRKVFKMAWLGEDLLEACKRAPTLADLHALPERKNNGNRTRRKARASQPAEKLIGGLFTAKEIELDHG
jgi:hypothetical protein